MEKRFPNGIPSLKKCSSLKILGDVIISDKVEFLKYFSLYTLADTRNIIANCEINIWCILISIISSVIFASLSYIFYNKKELL